jgi:hypothetical protein
MDSGTFAILQIKKISLKVSQTVDFASRFTLSMIVMNLYVKSTARESLELIF